MTPEEIRAVLKSKKLRQADLCRRWNMPACTVSGLVNRKFKSERLEKKMARLLGVTADEFRGGEEKQ